MIVAEPFEVVFIDDSPFEIVFLDNEQIEVDFGEIQKIGAEPYRGAYEVTPSAEEQTLATQNKAMLHDLIIHPIPNNYGLITWDGVTLTVS